MTPGSSRIRASDALTRAQATLRALEPATPDQVLAQSHAIDHLAEHGTAALSRSIPEHLTGSTIVFDAGLTSTLLCYHRKGRFWVQPGGHTDPEDDDLLAGALRELREETGLVRFTVPSSAPADIDRHPLGGGFGACAWHIDVGFVVVADPADPVAVSPESIDVAWWPVDALPAECADGLGARIGRARTFARAHGARGAA